MNLNLNVYNHTWLVASLWKSGACHSKPSKVRAGPSCLCPTTPDMHMSCLGGTLQGDLEEGT